MIECRGCLEGMALLIDDHGKRFHYDAGKDQKFACQESGPIKDTQKPELEKFIYPAEKLLSPTEAAKAPSKSFSRFEAIIEEAIAAIRKLSKEKGGEYAGDSDRLANFRRHAAENEVPMELIWKVYAGKHWDAVSQYIKDLVHSKTRPRSEPITGRVDDLIVYLLLFKLMYEERHGKS